MAAFEYVAIAADGKRTRGVIAADSARAARRELRLRQLTPLDVTEAKGEAREGLLTRGGLGAKDRALVTRQMAMLLSSGMTVEEALQAAAGDGRQPEIRRLLLGVRSQVMEGRRLADALAGAPKAFPQLYRSVVAAGEASGRLDDVMGRLADYLERSYRIRRQVQSALIYPAVLGVMALAMVTALMVFIVPRLVEQFDVLGSGDLPWLTNAVIALSEFVRSWGWLAALAVAAGVLVLGRLGTQPAIRRRLDAWRLSLPVVGPMQRTVAAARFARLYATLAGSGAPVLDALAGAKGGMTNTVFASAADRIADAVREGRSFSGAMRASGAFPAIMVQMAASGEAGRNLDGMMERAADFLESEFETASQTALSLLEPLIIVILGGVVGLIVLSIMLPIMQLNALTIQ